MAGSCPSGPLLCYGPGCLKCQCSERYWGARLWASNDFIPLYPFETQDIMGIAVPKPTKNTSCESYLCFQDALRVFCWPLKRWDDWINSDSRSFGSCFFWVGRRTVIEHHKCLGAKDISTVFPYGSYQSPNWMGKIPYNYTVLLFDREIFCLHSGSNDSPVSSMKDCSACSRQNARHSSVLSCDITSGHHTLPLLPAIRLFTPIVFALLMAAGETILKRVREVDFGSMVGNCHCAVM